MAASKQVLLISTSTAWYPRHSTISPEPFRLSLTHEKFNSLNDSCPQPSWLNVPLVVSDHFRCLPMSVSHHNFTPLFSQIYIFCWAPQQCETDICWCTHWLSFQWWKDHTFSHSWRSLDMALFVVAVKDTISNEFVTNVILQVLGHTVPQ